jgi:hypothetical protein
MAALWFCSKRLPETTLRVRINPASAQIVPLKKGNISNEGESGSPSGAACCHPIELPPYEAARLQTPGMRGRCVHWEDENEAPSHARRCCRLTPMAFLLLPPSNVGGHRR